MGQAHMLTTLIASSVQKTHWKSLTAGQSLKLVGVHLLLKSCLICISRLVVKIVESFSVRMAPRHHVWLLQVSYFGCFASLWKVISDQYLACMLSCSSSKFPLVEMMVGSYFLTALNVFH